MEIILNLVLLLSFFLQLSNTRDVAVVTAGGLFGNHTQREHADALTLRASFRPC